MSNNGYVKKFRHTYLRELKKKHTSAFLILDTVADHAKRKFDEGHLLLELGEAIITAEECGLTPQKFQTGLKFLENENLIIVMHRGRKDKKSKLEPRIKPESTNYSIPITSRINGTVVKLINSEYYDINIECAPNHIPNQTRINSYKTTHKEEIKNKEIQEEKEKYKKEKILPISSNEQEIPQAINQDFQASQPNITYIIETPSSPKKSKPKKEVSAEACLLAESLISKIKEVNPKFSKSSRKWGEDFDRLLKKRSFEDIKIILDWVFKEGCWWRTRVLSPDGLDNNLEKIEGNIISDSETQKKKTNNENSRAVLGGKRLEEYDKLW